MTEALQRIFHHAPDAPLLFTHLFFWGFFLLVLLLYCFFYKKTAVRNIYLLAVSLFFYFKTSGVFVVLLLFTICSDFLWAQAIARSKNPSAKKMFLASSVVINMLLLAYFKYSYFFAVSYEQITGETVRYFNHFAYFSNTWFSTGFSVDKLLLPVGVSFFTFQSLSYTIDVYRGKVEPLDNIGEYGFFVCFFPHLVAGPIVKAHDFLYQLREPYRLSRFEFGMCVFWIMNGFAKKIVADYIAVNYVDRIFSNPNYYTGVETIIGIFGYSLQIYMDFSGYTDMAIGLALLLGFRLRTNFNSPYKAKSPSEFWKRWHISLSTWLQEYLYIPLGGNRRGTIGSYVAITILAIFLVLLSGKLWMLWLLAGLAILISLVTVIFPVVRASVNTNINLMVTMLLGGLWHGSSWLFIIWGGLNGLGILVHKAWKKISPFRGQEGYAVSFFLMFCTLVFISFTRIFFRSDSMGTVTSIFDRISNHMGLELAGNIVAGYPFVLSLMAAGYLIHWVPENMKQRYREGFARLPVTVMGAVVVAVVFLLYQLMTAEMQPFIYFQF